MGIAVYTMHVGADGEFLNAWANAGDWHLDFDIEAECIRI